jgi:hypothetical protein
MKTKKEDKPADSWKLLTVLHIFIIYFELQNTSSIFFGRIKSSSVFLIGHITGNWDTWEPVDVA